MSNDTRFDDDNFDVDLSTYLHMIGGPSPNDSPLNGRSHLVLRRLYQTYGEDRVHKALDLFFEETPNW